MEEQEELILKNRIKEHRGRLNMSQEQLADAIRVNRMTIGNYETGKSTPCIVSALLIAEQFGVTVEQIFEINK